MILRNNEIFELNGDKIKCLKNSYCFNCIYNFSYTLCNKYHLFHGHCFKGVDHSEIEIECFPRKFVRL